MCSSSIAAVAALLSCVTTALSSPGDDAKRCLDTLDGAPFETVCYRTLANASGGLLTVREYKDADADAFLVSYSAPSSITTYQEALMLTSFYVISYFTNHSLASSRTVPLTLRPPTPAHDEWVAGMALAPSNWPPASHPPPAIYDTVVAPLGAFTFASLRAVVQQSPQPSDFDALCVQLRAGVQQELPAWRVDEA